MGILKNTNLNEYDGIDKISFSLAEFDDGTVEIKYNGSANYFEEIKSLGKFDALGDYMESLDNVLVGAVADFIKENNNYGKDS
ncbi:MAG: hypothetical protein LBI42_09560 [Chitinispirillales bacterium]|jgi:hypothetical protein|nr:hypothetical protein [Chitinispirillales bacterium]